MVQQNERVKSTILITGATGNVGGAVIANLIAQGAQVRALIRDQSKAQALEDSGVEVVVGDLGKPETLDAAFHGVDKVFLLTAVGPDSASQASNAIAAAKQAGRPHVVRMSAIAAALHVPSRLKEQHLRTEEELKESGLPYTILRPDFFMQNTILAAQTVASDSMVYMALKDGKFGMIDVRDIADVASAVLTSEGHEAQTYHLTGPASISFHDVATGLSKALNKEVSYMDVPPEMARKAMLSVGIPDWTALAYAEVFAALAHGFGYPITDDVEKVTGLPPRSYEAFARDYAEAFGGVHTAQMESAV